MPEPILAKTIPGRKGRTPDRCDIGGTTTHEFCHRTFDGPAEPVPVYEEPCDQPPTHRYHGQGFVEGHWNGRCYQHVKMLDTSVCTIEEL